MDKSHKVTFPSRRCKIAANLKFAGIYSKFRFAGAGLTKEREREREVSSCELRIIHEAESSYRTKVAGLGSRGVYSGRCEWIRYPSWPVRKDNKPKSW